MAIVFNRIDDRLIHGQVVTTWVNMHNIEQIIILNDDISKDKIQRNILTMAAPTGIKVRIFSIEKFGEIIKDNEINRRTMLLFTNSEDVYRAVQLGVPIKELNIGGMRFREGREQLTKAVSVTPDEEAAFKNLLEMGVEITIQMVPNDQKINLKEVI
ncbi:PTS sugar transporter subunit IIB [Vagococcus lutrae]|uniref:PTS system mannose/fructose/N-acetylgalactosamine-transporter subunit IIB n=1 Tax=Vagococcus lutrae TaxID=81947 RepID=UPI00200D241F|nr:PTS sugar transporter subunit IIB [Vagococcus lutrae]MDY3705797.1 PTS sugar transporter subunit IIB [Vagococcus lutrae]UQF37677.1 PTS sugar transporter subunit IIB [Vagococcus lutrae]